MSQLPAQQSSKSLSPADEFRGSLSRMEGQIKMLLPAHVPLERFSRVVMTAIQKTPKLLEANRASLFAACLDAAKDGLLPDGRESALVPYGEKVTYISMTAGILKKIRNSGELGSISPHIVHEGDEFEYFVDEKGEHLLHRPNFGEQGKAKCAYVVAIMKDGGVYIEVMTMSQIDAIRKRSRSSGAGPWVTDFDEMAKKTVIRRLAKRLPMSTDLDEMFSDREDFAPVGNSEAPQAPEASEQTSEQEPKQAAPNRLKGAMAANKSTQQPQPQSVPESQPAQTVAPATAPQAAKPIVMAKKEEPAPVDFNSDELPL